MVGRCGIVIERDTNKLTIAAQRRNIAVRARSLLDILLEAIDCLRQCKKNDSL
jgi:hypothetical protein